MIYVNLAESGEQQSNESERITILKVWKPHNNSITKLSINPHGNILVSGAEDKTLFIHQVLSMQPFVEVYPIGFIEFPAPVTAISWKPNMVII